MRNSVTTYRNKGVENLPNERLHLDKVGQHIQHDTAPLFIFQLLSGRCTCASELPLEKAELRFIFASIVTRGWIMHARKEVRFVVFLCEGSHLLPNGFLCNGSLNFGLISTFCSNSLQTSLDWIAPPGLHGPPHTCLIGEVHNQMLHRQEEAGWKDLLQLTDQHRCRFFQVTNDGPVKLLCTKLAKEIAQLCKHLPYMIRDIASNHCWKKPLNPDVEVMTLHPVDS